jgi:hypothetical protein
MSISACLAVISDLLMQRGLQSLFFIQRKLVSKYERLFLRIGYLNAICIAMMDRTFFVVVGLWSKSADKLHVQP